LELEAVVFSFMIASLAQPILITPV